MLKTYKNVFVLVCVCVCVFILRYIHTNTQIIYALQERGDLELETVDLCMEPEGYSLAILFVHMVLLHMEYVHPIYQRYV